jgi:hypothetical protein
MDQPQQIEIVYETPLLENNNNKPLGMKRMLIIMISVIIVNGVTFGIINIMHSNKNNDNNQTPNNESIKSAKSL